MPRSLLLLLLAGVAASLLLSGCGGGAASSASDTATVAIRYSRFEPELLTAIAGEPVTITIRNDDPIEHEWIIGSVEVHESHRTGTERFHNLRPTEVTVPAFEERVTTLTFAEPGVYEYICHLPGHETYGMVGTLVVVSDES